MSTKKLVTYALPYANGQLHLGHMLGMVQADAYVNALRMMGQDVVFVCGDDAHGTPIMLNAQKQGVSPEQLIQDIGQDHIADIQSFGIHYDVYGSTHDALNQSIVHAVYHQLQSSGKMIEKEIKQAYDQSEEMFLPDRFIKGACPLCGAEDQYGDHCEVCGKTYALRELRDPISIVSNQPPVWRHSSHVFYQLSSDQVGAESWLSAARVQDSIRNKLSEWFVDGLQDWDITRDAPYFGISIPNRDKQYFYVWLDAPFGYMCSFARALGLEKVEDIFNAWNQYEVSHFIGKDIVYFHGIFWPAVLKAAKLRQPDHLHVHGFVTLSAQKMSKSRGHYISPKAFVQVLPSDMMRYYMASRLSDGVSDIDIEWEDFKLKINSDLVGKLANLCSRSQGFIHKYNQGVLADKIDEGLWNNLLADHQQIRQAYESVNLSLVVKLVMSQCDLVNQYVDAHKPWQLAKEGKLDDAVYVSSTALNAFRYLMSCLSPIIPDAAKVARACFADEVLGFYTDALFQHPVKKFGHLFSRVENEHIQQLKS